MPDWDERSWDEWDEASRPTGVLPDRVTEVEPVRLQSHEERLQWWAWPIMLAVLVGAAAAFLLAWVVWDQSP